MRDRALRLRLHARMGRMVVYACAAACACIAGLTVALTPTASTSGYVTVCIGKAHTIDAKELYLARVKGFCGPGVKKLKWYRPNGHGTVTFCVGDPDGTSEFKTE